MKEMVKVFQRLDGTVPLPPDSMLAKLDAMPQPNILTVGELTELVRQVQEAQYNPKPSRKRAQRQLQVVRAEG